METTLPNETLTQTVRATRALELVREVERVLHEMNEDLTLAEAKLATTREMIARRREHLATTA